MLTSRSKPTAVDTLVLTFEAGECGALQEDSLMEMSSVGISF